MYFSMGCRRAPFLNLTLLARFRPDANLETSAKDSFVKLRCNLTNEFEGRALNESRPIGDVAAKREIPNSGERFLCYITL